MTKLIPEGQSGGFGHGCHGVYLDGQWYAYRVSLGRPKLIEGKTRVPKVKRNKALGGK